MKLPLGIFFALALTLLSVGDTFGYDPDKRALYTSALIVSAGNNPEWLAELKVSAAQKKRLEATAEKRNEIDRRYAKECEKVLKSKLGEAAKNAKLRALETQVSDDLLRAYGEVLRDDQIKRMKQLVVQFHGMDIFDFPEVRGALKIGDTEVKKLREAYSKWAVETRAELDAKVKAKKLTNPQAAKLASGYGLSVPDSVRQLLNNDQKKVIDELVGADPAWRKP